MHHDERRLRTGIIQTRVPVALALLLVIGLTDWFDRPWLVASFVAAYAASTVLIWYLSSKRVIAWRRIRAVFMGLDLLAVSLVVWSTGGVESQGFLLYLFPILSAARILGTGRSRVVALLAAVGYVVACYAAADGGRPPAPETLLFRIAVLVAVSLAGARSARSLDRAEERLLRAIEDIDRAILEDTDVKRVTRSILHAAINITDSEVSAIKLADGIEDAVASAEHRGGQEDVAAAAAAVNQHYQPIHNGWTTTSLPRGSTLATALTRLHRSGPEGWATQFVPLAIGNTWLGVLGVFSRRRWEYKADDVRRLSRLANQVAMAQKNARLYKENRDRLKILYEISERLKSEQTLDVLFQNVVELVSAHLGSEEAALFLPDGGDMPNGQAPDAPLRKVAVAGPDAAVKAKLVSQEELYSEPQSLTGKVFWSKEARRENRVNRNEPHAAAHAALLPSGDIRHYLGAPLLIGDEALGVIRALNKRAKGYRPVHGAAVLDQDGFGNDDLALLSAIATQVASAIRNAGFVEQHAHFRNLVYNSPDPIIVIDAEGRIRHFNCECEALWGMSEAEVLGTDVSRYYESLEHAREIGRKLRENAEAGLRNEPAKILTANHEVIPIRLSATQLRDRNGRPAGSIGVFTDEREVIRLTEDKITAEKLAAVGRLAQAKGHDIKNDLATVLAWSGMLLDTRGNGDEATLRACSAIQAAATRARTKLQDMLMAANPHPPRMERMSLRSILESLEASVRYEAAAPGVEFRVSYPEGEHLLLADAEQMRQVFSNLFGNSLDAIAKARESDPDLSRGQIGVDVGIEKDGIELRWCDDGSGMSEEVRTRAFTPLFTTKETGSGLGLFITKTIVESHGGSISIEPASGHGTRFRIRLPLFRASETPRAAPPPPQQIEQGQTP
ncbi:MAG: ATP-binding protein [Longimicrobiaceae bacterium]